MALTPNFTSSEDLYSNDLVTFTDTSTGSDGTLTVRHITIQLDDGTYLVPSGTSTNYIVWNYSDTSISVSILTKSTAATVLVEWFDNPLNAPLYTSTKYMEWNLYDYLFLFGKLGNQTSHPLIIEDINYYSNVSQMICNLFQSENAITNMNDVYSAQAALDRNQYLIDNESTQF